MPTSDTPDRSATRAWVGSLVSRHRRSVVACTLGGLVLGGLFALVSPATYTAESRLLVGTFEAPSAAIPGYVLASQTVAANYARLATSTPVLEKLPTDLSVSPSEITSMTTVTAVPESALIRVVATSGDSGKAREAAEAMATALDDTVAELNAGNSGDALLAQYSAAAQELNAATAQQTAAQGALDRAVQVSAATSQAVVDAQAALAAAKVAFDTATLKVKGLATQYQTQQETVSTSSQMRVLGGAEVSENSRLLTVISDMVIGAVLGVVLGMGLAWRRDRRDLRVTTAAAAGSAG